MLLNERIYTVEEFWELSQRPENVDKHWELIEGVIYEVSPGHWLHGDVGWILNAYMSIHVLQNNLGRMTLAETGFMLAENIMLAPDIGFIQASNIVGEITEAYVPFRPDLAVEVVSPSNSRIEIAEKTQLYIQHGTRLVWVVYPKKHEIHVYRAGDTQNKAIITYLGIEDTLSGEDVLPSFSLPLKTLFPQNK